jgi:quinol monooxygenase YgiN
MITRIVRMEFDPSRQPEFEAVFEASKAQIRAFEGCRRLELHRDAAQPNVYYTLSEWDSEAALDTYRHSQLFANVWARTKIHFAGKPQAYSLLLHQRIDT